jgi:hypothetical protein
MLSSAKDLVASTKAKVQGLGFSEADAIAILRGNDPDEGADLNQTDARKMAWELTGQLVAMGFVETEVTSILAEKEIGYDPTDLVQFKEMLVKQSRSMADPPWYFAEQLDIFDIYDNPQFERSELARLKQDVLHSLLDEAMFERNKQFGIV